MSLFLTPRFRRFWSSVMVCFLGTLGIRAEESTPLPPLPEPLSVPSPGPETDRPYAPQPSCLAAA